MISAVECIDQPANAVVALHQLLMILSGSATHWKGFDWASWSRSVHRPYFSAARAESTLRCLCRAGPRTYQVVGQAVVGLRDQDRKGRLIRGQQLISYFVRYKEHFDDTSNYWIPLCHRKFINRGDLMRRSASRHTVLSETANLTGKQGIRRIVVETRRAAAIVQVRPRLRLPRITLPYR